MIELRKFSVNEKVDLERPEHFPITLTSNTSLDRICERIVTTELDWDKLFKDYQAREIFYPENTRGQLAELWLENLLLDAATKDPSINVYPFSHKPTSTENFMIRKKHRTITAYTKDGTSFAEYDGLITANGLPVVFESKVVNHENKRTSNAAFGRMMKTERVTKLFAPLQEHFKTNIFGYVLMTTPEGINHKSEVQQNFRAEGGILIGMNVSFKEMTDRSLGDNCSRLKEIFNARRS